MRDAQGNPHEMAKMIHEDYASLAAFKEKTVSYAGKQ